MTPWIKPPCPGSTTALPWHLSCLSPTSATPPPALTPLSWLQPPSLPVGPLTPPSCSSPRPPTPPPPPLPPPATATPSPHPALVLPPLPLITISTSTTIPDCVATYSFLTLFRSPHHHQHCLQLLNNYLLPTQPPSPPYLSKMSFVFSILVLLLKSDHHGCIYQRIRATDDQSSLWGKATTQHICSETHH